MIAGRRLAGRRLAVAALAVVGALVVDASPQGAATSAVIPSPSAGPVTGACNNSPELCGRQYNKITHMGVHDSSFLRDKSTGNSPAGNQFRNATLALDAGFRLLQSQVHKVDSGLRLCHSSCGILDAGPLDAWLARVGAWVNRNPSDVVTLVLVNSGGGATASELASAFDRSAITKFVYKPASTAATTNWPTLQTMISQGSRVVVFITDTEPSPDMPYMLPHFRHIFETPFEVTQMTGFNCSLDRPKSVGAPAQALAGGYMGLVNHFKDRPMSDGIVKTVVNSVGLGDKIMVPDQDKVDTVNSADVSAAGSLGRHLQQCRSEWGQQPNFALVDFWDRGDAVQVADNLNGVNSATGRKVAQVTSAAAGRATRFAAACLMAAPLWLL